MAPLRALQIESLTQERIVLLRAANIHSLEALYVADEFQLSEATKLSREVILKMKTEIELGILRKWRTGEEDEETEMRQRYIETELKDFDLMLGGGLRTGELVELIGSSASGKSQLSLWASSAVLHSHQGNVLYLDSSGSFSSYRIRTMVSSMSKGLKHGEINRMMQSRIRCFSVTDYYEMHDLLQTLESLITDERDAFFASIQLIVIDSIGTILAPMLSKGSSQGFSLAVLLGRALRKFARDHNIAVVVTNHVVSSGEQQTRPALGKSWAQIAQTRIILTNKPDSPNQKIVSMLSCIRPTHVQCAHLQIKEDGLSLCEGS